MDILKDKKIFVLDNSLAFREALRMMLEAHSAEVESCASSDEALMKIIRWHPHLLITGVEIGKINGYDLCLVMKLMPDYAGMPIVLISSGKHDTAMRKASDAGADYYVQKNDKLVSSVKDLVTRIFTPEEPKPDSKQKKRHIESVLVVDDSRVMRQVIKNILSSVGIEKVVEASDGIKALDVLENSPVDLVLTDWNMPRMDGLTFVRNMRKENKFDHVPVVMVTTESRKKEVDLAAKAGVNGHLCKPFNINIFKDMLADFATNIG